MSRNILNNQGVYINTISGGDAINVSSNNSTFSTVNVDISKQTSNTTIANTDLFLLQDNSGNVRKITGANMKSVIDTNFWTYSSPSLRPNNTSDNLLLGTSSNTNSRKFLVVGDSEFGDIYIPTDKKLISTNNVNDYLKFSNGTFTNNYSSNVITNSISFGATADLNLATGRAITRGTDSKDRITFNSGNCTFGNKGIFNNSVQVKSTINSNSGNVEFFEPTDAGPSKIALHAPLTLTHTYNAFLPQNTDTSLLNVYILSNKNVLAGTNVSISNSTTDTITINATDTNTTYTGGTNITLSGTTFNLDTTLVGNLTWTGSQTYENTLEITGPANSLGYINLYSNDNNKISLKTNVNIGSSYDIILPSSTGTLLTNQDIIQANKGGTGFQTYTIGDILYANTTTSLSKLPVGLSNTFLMSNGSNPVWGAGYSFTSPLGITATNVDLGGLSGFGSANQIIATASDGSNNLQYRTLTEGTGITITHTSSAITFTGPSVYWKRNSNTSSFDIETTNDVNNIDVVVPFQTSSTLKTTGGLISGSGDYLKWVVYGSNYRALESYCVVPSAPALQGTTHFLLKNGEADYPSIKQNTAGSLFIHFENNGDCFEVNKAFEYGHRGAKWKYTDPFTYLYNPEDTNGAASSAGSIMQVHKNGSVIFFNTTSTYLSGNTNYFSFAKSDDQEARITMNGIGQISDEWLDNSDPSDRRIKYDIQDYQNATDVINKIKIKSFMKYRIKNFNNDKEGNMLPFKDRLGEARYSIGVIAQELYEIPELSFMVRQSDFNDTTPAYIHDWKPIISLLVKSNQEQQEEINTLKTELENIKSILLKNNIS